MKQKKENKQKQGGATCAKTAAAPCGTLCYMAECRGGAQKENAPQRPQPAGTLFRIERR